MGLFRVCTAVFLIGLASSLTADLKAETAAETTGRTQLVEQPHLGAQFLSSVDSFSRGDSFWTAVKLEPEQGWHTYWINPGDSGLATQIDWNLPEGVSAGEIIWPVAEKYRIGALANYGFENTTYLLTEISVDSAFNAQQLTLENRVDWLVCDEFCIPGSAEFSLTLNHSNDPAEINSASFDEARANLPETATWPAYFDIESRVVTLLIEHPDAVELAQHDDFYAYVGAGELVEHAEDADVTVTDDTLLIRRSLNTYFSGVDDNIPLLLSTPGRSVLVTATAANEESLITAATAAEEPPTPLHLGLVFTFAFLGGLLLNLMPCVFPVLSLKALSMANAHNNQGREAFAYTLGVVITFVTFAAILLALRASGEALGWGFQLQSSLLIGLLTLLFVTIGLNLSGVFQIGTRLSQLANYGQTAQSGGKGSFATGVLAVLIASPCTAPFMGVALGVAITQSAPVALLIFATLGLGLAFPFVLLALLPGTRRLLPKPGAWMDTFKQWMAIPIYLTSVWLLWVFARQAGTDSQALLLSAVVLLGTALWLHGRRQLQVTPGKGSFISVLLFLVFTAGAFYTAVQIQSDSHRSGSTDSQQWQVWSEQKLEESRTSGPVFVNMTADWCVTCLANERVALETTATRNLFSEHDITYLKGDWTLQDPAITDYLAQYGRNGVPLYVLYWPNKEPVVLPQILTSSIISSFVLESIEGASDI